MNEHKSLEEKTPEERAAAKAKIKAQMKACNDRSYARMAEINRIASETLAKTTHVGYETGQYGQDYMAFGKAIGEIRRLVRESIGDVAPDYEMLALQFARNSFEFSKFKEALMEVAEMKKADFPGFYYTPGWLVELAKKLEAEQAGDGRAVSTKPPSEEDPAVSGCPSLGPKVFPSGADGTAPAPEKLAAFCQSEMQREEARRLRKIHWACYQTKVDLAVVGKTRQNGKVYEVRVAKRQADVSDTYAQIKVNGKTVLTGRFTGSAWMAKRMMTAAALALVNHKAKRNRDKRRNYKKRDAAKRAAETKALIAKELA